MSIQDACEFCRLDRLDAPKVSELVSEIAGKFTSGFVSWKTMLSAVEIKLEEGMSDWAPLEVPNQQDR